MRPPYAVLIAFALLAGLAADAHAATLTGTTSEGVRIALTDRTVALRVPGQTPRGATLRIACGSRTNARKGYAVAAARRVRPHQPLRLRLRGELGPVEWCTFETAARNVDFDRLPEGAAVMHPRPSLPPAPLRPGPGVREAFSTEDDEVGGESIIGGDGDAHFLLSGTVVTLRLRSPIVHSTTVNLVCGAGENAKNVRYRIVAVGRGRRVITTDIGPEPERPAEWCLLEAGVFGAGDITAATFPR